MYIMDSIIGLFTLKWAEQKPMLQPLPPHIQRTFVETPNGDLELLICEPDTNTSAYSQHASQAAPIFFAHGGYGSAGVWLEWMTYLHKRGYPATLYAYSVRNHGASYSLPYWRMVFQTPFEDIQADMAACLEYVGQHHQNENENENENENQNYNQNSTTRPPILVGHSSGGGVSQKLLSGTSPNASLKTKASGLCLVDAIPSYGSYDMYWNWWEHDPWFTLRSLFHLQHPTSPLSTVQLVHGAFFGRKFPRSRTESFKQWMPAFESMGWPLGMLGASFWAWAGGRPNTWLKARGIVENIVGAGAGVDRVCVVVGREDMMYRPWMWERQCEEYRDALGELRAERGEKVDGAPVREGSDQSEIEAVEVTRGGGVRLVLVEESGHHVQNDVHCDQAAEALMRWANQV